MSNLTHLWKGKALQSFFIRIGLKVSSVSHVNSLSRDSVSHANLLIRKIFVVLVVLVDLVFQRSWMREINSSSPYLILQTSLSYRQASCMFKIGKTTAADTFNSILLGLEEIFARMFPPPTRESDLNISTEVSASVPEQEVGMVNVSSGIGVSSLQPNKPRCCLMTHHAAYNACRNGIKFKSSKYFLLFSLTVSFVFISYMLVLTLPPLSSNFLHYILR